MSNLPKKCHFIGVGGIGMSGLARILAQNSIIVSGSDLHSSAVTEQLSHAGMTIFHGHHADNISSDMTVVYSSDIKTDNIEIQAARNCQCPLWHRSQLLHCLMEEKKSLAIAGTHGKTTTSSLLTSVLVEAGLDPTYIVGGILSQFQTNASSGNGEYLVAEADESDGTFLNYFPFGAIVTNIDRDHMDFFENDETLLASFQTFLSQVKSSEHLFWCGDDLNLCSLNPKGYSYGFQPSCQWRATEVYQKGWSSYFDAEFKGRKFSMVEVALTGEHNVLNALAVFGLAIHLGIEESVIRSAFKKFKGVKRRCEIKGEIAGTLFIDDYAHHPTEIQATLKAVRVAIQNKSLLVVFQPHRFTRTRDCLGDFGTIFHDADQLIITDIYAAGEEPIPGITHKLLLQECPQARYIPRNELAESLQSKFKAFDFVITLGAGDITKLTTELLSILSRINTIPS